MNHLDAETNLGEALLLDISPSGLKLRSSLNIPLEQNEVEIEVSFTLNQNPFTLCGLLVWLKQRGEDFLYGIQLKFEEEPIQSLLLQEIKEYIKANEMS